MLKHVAGPQRRLASGLLTRKYTAQSYDKAPNGLFKYPKTAELIASAKSPERIPTLHGLPEVIVTGRANCGKSSLFNAVLGRRALLPTSKKAGRTRALDFFRVGAEPGKLLLVDSPGYGAMGRPEWGELFDKYLETRQELKRVYIVFNGKHPLNAYDINMLAHLSEIIISRHERFTLQAVITKLDDVDPTKVDEHVRQIRMDIQKATPLCLPPILTSVHMCPHFGVQELRRNIEKACGLASNGDKETSTVRLSPGPWQTMVPKSR